ncbi:OmpW/AlkL family protein [Aliikangiella maris]|uniref:OmpW family outer membrane protein n=2 Tax=Aliikangiella maris TaxID=3162458 RepID=A0ABV3MJN8_9GAMM
MKKLTIALAISAALSTPFVAAQDNADNWIFRVGVAHVSPNDDSGEVLGGGVGVDSDTGLAFSATYMVDANWGVEVLGALPFSHDIVGTGSLSGAKLGETKHLPPVVSLVYQWGEETQFHVGAGLNYTVFFEEESSSTLDTALNAQAKLDLESSTGLAFKVGFDTPMTDGWKFTGSLRYIQIDTTADVIINDSVAASVDVDIDPWVVMLGVSTTF